MSGPASELAHLFRALKAPAAARAFPALADRAREESWSYEKFLQALLATEVSVRDSHGGENRIKAARFPARKTLEEFDFAFQHSIKKQVIEHLGQLDFLHARQNVILLGPPGTGKIAYSHTGRLRSEAAFASLAGAAPIPASSGQTIRYRLNRGGDRQLNRALHTITLSRLKHHHATRAYAHRRAAEGKTSREIKRCLKRYLARQIYRQLQTNPRLNPIPANSVT
jgi:hypothetical protein